MVCNVCHYRWHWQAMYQDGTYVYECDDKGTHHEYSDLKITDALTIGWEPVGSREPVIYTALPDEDSRLVLFRRHQIMLNTGGDRTTTLPTIHGLGWESIREYASAVGNYQFILEHGQIITSSNKNIV